MKRYIAEFIAAFFLVFVGTAAIVADQQETVTRLQSSIGTLGVALAFGLALAVVIAAVGRISGGYANPAVSVAFYIAKRISLKDLGGYIAAQLLGGLVAAVVVKQIFAPEIVESVGSGAVGLGEGITLLQGGLIEVMLTFFLVFVIWGVAVDPKGPKIIAPLAIGLTVTFDVIIGASATGAAMNPARWFGPAVMGGALDANWPVWVLGPIVGALIASTAYELFFLDTADDLVTVEDLEDLEPRAPEILPPTPAESAAEDAADDAADAAGGDKARDAGDEESSDGPA